MPTRNAARKEKRTFSLTRESVSYLESLRKQKKGSSTSAVLEELIRQQRQASEMQRISASVTRYYDSLTDEEVAEDRAWGQFAETQFPTED
jgi:hypothetical protein